MGEMGDTVTNKVREIVIDQLDVEPEKVTLEAVILEDLGADSLDLVELVMALEEAFDMEVPDEDVETLRTVADVARYIEERVGS